MGVEETRFNFSNLSIQRKSKTRTVNGTDKRDKQKSDWTEMTDEQDQKSYETIQKIIQGGHVEKLKVDQCKVYLRKHGLRLSGNKDTLIQRIKEHNNIVNGGGEEKYPESSFVLNCKGDACTGDVVIFEHNVYDMFNIASRSANGPPCGTRIVAGRIVKESYGAAKQQHTFTIEVLWSKGEKPLPPLHPLLIKGRNLYRLKTMRQKWQDEAEREKILAEKHARGGVARLSREAHVQKKEMRKLQRQNRATGNEDPHTQKLQEKRKTSCSASTTTRPDKLIDHPKQEYEQKIDCCNKSQNIPNKSGNLIENPKSILGAPPELIHQRQPLISVNRSFHDRPGNYFTNLHSPGTQVQMITCNENQRFIYARSPVRGFGRNYVNGRRNDINVNGSRYSHQSSGANYYNGQENFTAGHNASVQETGYGRKQMCRYYPRGMCHFGDRCKFLHE